MNENKMEIDTTDKIIFKFPVLWECWECDSEAWIMEKLDKTRYILMTNHGSKYIANKGELWDRIEEYKTVIRKTETALDILKENVNE